MLLPLFEGNLQPMVEEALYNKTSVIFVYIFFFFAQAASHETLHHESPFHTLCISIPQPSNPKNINSGDFRKHMSWIKAMLLFMLDI